MARQFQRLRPFELTAEDAAPVLRIFPSGKIGLKRRGFEAKFPEREI
jgi:hypothetical protein